MIVKKISEKFHLRNWFQRIFRIFRLQIFYKKISKKKKTQTWIKFQEPIRKLLMKNQERYNQVMEKKMKQADWLWFIWRYESHGKRVNTVFPDASWVSYIWKACVTKIWQAGKSWGYMARIITGWGVKISGRNICSRWWWRQMKRSSSICKSEKVP